MAIETNKKKLVLVTGASGYLGGNLCRALLRDGHSVRAFVRPTSRLPSVDDAGPLEVAYGDVTDYPSLLAACSGCDVIFHTAALVEPWLPDPSRFFSVTFSNLQFHIYIEPQILKHNNNDDKSAGECGGFEEHPESFWRGKDPTEDHIYIILFCSWANWWVCCRWETGDGIFLNSCNGCWVCWRLWETD